VAVHERVAAQPGGGTADGEWVSGEQLATVVVSRAPTVRLASHAAKRLSRSSAVPTTAPGGCAAEGAELHTSLQVRGQTPGRPLTDHRMPRYPLTTFRAPCCSLRPQTTSQIPRHAARQGAPPTTVTLRPHCALLTPPRRETPHTLHPLAAAPCSRGRRLTRSIPSQRRHVPVGECADRRRDVSVVGTDR